MRGSSTSELVFENCLVPEENVLGQMNGGVRVLMSGLDYERAVLGGGPLGLMAAALDLVLPYVHERKQFGQPIGTFELMQAKVADMYASLNAARAYSYAIGRACDAGRCSRQDAAAAILFGADRATQVCLEAIQALGGNGYINDYAAGPPAARRQALRDRRRHAGNPPHAHRPRALRAHRMSPRAVARSAQTTAPRGVRAHPRRARLPQGGRRAAGAHHRPHHQRRRPPAGRRSELARQFGVHRGTVREALRELETNGVLKRERGSKLMMVTRPARVTVAAGVSAARSPCTM